MDDNINSYKLQDWEEETQGDMSIKSPIFGG
jgi:hypothetical protein